MRGLVHGPHGQSTEAGGAHGLRVGTGSGSSRKGKRKGPDSAQEVGLPVRTVCFLAYSRRRVSHPLDLWFQREAAQRDRILFRSPTPHPRFFLILHSSLPGIIKDKVRLSAKSLGQSFHETPTLSVQLHHGLMFSSAPDSIPWDANLWIPLPH